MEGVEEYITKEFLEEQLKSSVESFTISPGSNAGDNYTSVLYAIEVILKSSKKKLHLLMKAYPSLPQRQVFLNMANIFKKELSIYSQWIPALKTLDENFKFSFAPFVSGNAIDYSTFPPGEYPPFQFLDNYILMTDVRKTSGFIMADRLKGLNFQHTKIVLEELAKIHACSWVYKKRNNLKKLTEKYRFLIDESFNGVLLEQFKPLMEVMHNQAFNILKEALGEDSVIIHGVEKWGNNDARMAKLQAFMNPEGINEEQIESWLRVKPKQDNGYDTEPWLVSCHGDAWLNNMLFRYKTNVVEETPEEVSLVDLQLCREACPTLDLTYFLISSTRSDIRRKHESEFLEIYYKEFVRTCKAFSVEAMSNFTLENLKRRYRRGKIFGYLMCIAVLQIVLQDPADAIDLDTIQTDETEDMSEMFSKTIMGKKKGKLLEEELSALAQELYDDGVV